MEQWKPVAGLPYEVSDQGRVRRTANGSRTKAGRLLNPIVKRTGYRYVTLFGQKRPRQLRLHRVVAEAFLGPCPANQEVHHKNGDRADNRLCNLQYVTPKQHHTIEPRALCGEKNARARLTLEQVVAIRQRRANGEKIVTIASDYPFVSYWAIRNAAAKRSWRHVAGLPNT